MNYVGIDWAYGRAAWCARSETPALHLRLRCPCRRDRGGVHTLARIMGTSIEMIERHYGTLDGAMEEIAGRLDALEADRRDRTEES